MWTPENRRSYNQDRLRCPRDLTDEEWLHIEREIPPAKTRRARPGGRCQGSCLRTDVCAEHEFPVAHVPKHLPPRSTLHGYLQRWQYDGTLARIHHVLYMACREQIGREASPTACVIDSQSVKSADLGREERTKGGPASTQTGTPRARRSRERSGISWSIR